MTIPYRIVRIETKQFAIFPDLFKNGEPAEVMTSFGFALNEDSTSILCQSLINYIQDGKILLVMELATYFQIAEDGRKEIKNHGSVPVDFLRYMGTIAVGTARGIIHSKTEGTVLNSVVLPPINLVDAIKEDLVINNK
ncbi:MAG: hypothetical protein IJL58_05865 [Bacteroidales bacterium]|nr:hypothetical protein [Bacteroidales bacterium]MBQ6184904.1 hypothetical protein [Bacteroidales bacterium]